MTGTGRITSLLIVLLTITLNDFAQGGQSPPPDAGTIRSGQTDRRDVSRRLTILADLERQTGKRPKDGAVLRPAIDKEDQERVEAARRVLMKDAAPYVELLKNKDAGIFKVFPNMNCVSENVVNVSAQCSDFVPASSLVSFRQRAYIDDPNQDIEYVDGEIRANGFFVQGAMIDLGDIALDAAVADKALMTKLKSIGKADASVDEARITSNSLKNGLAVDGTVFSNHLNANVGHTYLFRSIAYRAKASLPAISSKSTATELRFHVLEMDERVDLLMVFRILSRDAKGGLTIVWKELGRSEAPALRFAKGQPLGDFK